jgi:acetylornithine deacetylase/succinyl-diaminopimelate desuccinylase-like protein
MELSRKQLMVQDKKVSDYIHDNQGRFVEDIIRLSSQPSVSARKEGMDECAEIVKTMVEEIGATATMIKLPGVAPLVYGEVKSTKSSKTVLFYNHYDVQPEDPLDLWKSPPFKPEVRDGRLYGRGVSDDKGELVSRLKLVESYIKVNGEPPCNVKFCFEGEEEVGSPHLEEYVAKNPDLFKADAVIWEYGKIDGEGRPVVGLGVKGMIYLEMTVKALSHDAHSMYAAALPSAVWRLTRLLGIIKDSHERILIPGWYDRVQDLAEDELELLEEQPSEAQELLQTYGAKEFAGGMSIAQAKKSLVARPTANIAGIWAGYTGPGSKTVLPAEAHCKMDFRLVSNQDPDELFGRLTSHLKENGYGDVVVVKETMEPAARTSYKSDLAQAAIKAAKEVFAKDPVIELSSAGTGPLYIFTRRYGVPALDIGISPMDAALHSPNENIRLDLLEKGMLWLGRTVENYLGR